VSARSAQLSTAVALFLFRRPDRTRSVVERVRDARPERLFLIADGPRPESPEDRHECELARAVVAEVDWPCEVTRIYADENIGLRLRIPTGIDEVFRSVDRAILLEDDCLPDPAFFPFCEEMLRRYADDERVMHVAGSQLLRPAPAREASYHFSRYPHIWGWGTWRRAWATYDVDLAGWQRLGRRQRDARLAGMFEDDSERRYWRYVWDGAREIESWDAQWSYALLDRSGLAVNPNSNLVSNIGFGEGATNAVEDPYGIAGRRLEGIAFPLRHPETVAADAEADARASLFFRRDTEPPGPPLRERVRDRVLRAGGRALDFVPEPVRPKIRHRDREPRR
jgi:hypothetical protein